MPRQLPLVVRQAIIRRDDAARRRVVELSRSRRARVSPLPLRQHLGTAQCWSWTFVSPGTSVDVVVAQVRSVSYLPDAWVIVAVSRSRPAATPTTTTNFSGVPQGSSLSPVVLLEHADDSVIFADDASPLVEHTNNLQLQEGGCPKRAPQARGDCPEAPEGRASS